MEEIGLMTGGAGGAEVNPSVRAALMQKMRAELLRGDES
jgi:hypothetical protein